MVSSVAFFGLLGNVLGDFAIPPSNMPSKYRSTDTRVAVKHTQHFCSNWCDTSYADQTLHMGSEDCASLNCPEIFKRTTVRDRIVNDIHRQPCSKCVNNSALFCSEDGTSGYSVTYSPFSPECSVPVGDCDECVKPDPSVQDDDGCMLLDKSLCLPVEINMPQEASCSQVSCVAVLEPPPRMGGGHGTTAHEFSAYNTWFELTEGEGEPSLV